MICIKYGINNLKVSLREKIFKLKLKEKFVSSLKACDYQSHWTWKETLIMLWFLS